MGCSAGAVKRSSRSSSSSSSIGPACTHACQCCPCCVARAGSICGHRLQPLLPQMLVRRHRHRRHICACKHGRVLTRVCVSVCERTPPHAVHCNAATPTALAALKGGIDVQVVLCRQARAGAFCRCASTGASVLRGRNVHEEEKHFANQQLVNVREGRVQEHKRVEVLLGRQ